jgi:Fic family protein
MKNFIKSCNLEENNNNKILEKISNIHYDFVKIHPFSD